MGTCTCRCCLWSFLLFPCNLIWKYHYLSTYIHCWFTHYTKTPILKYMRQRFYQTTKDAKIGDVGWADYGDDYWNGWKGDISKLSTEARSHSLADFFSAIMVSEIGIKAHTFHARRLDPIALRFCVAHLILLSHFMLIASVLFHVLILCPAKSPTNTALQVS